MKQEIEFKKTEIGLIPEDWNLSELGVFCNINPLRKLVKKIIAKKVSMASVKEFTRKIQYYENAEYKGGSKFKNEDIIMARITPCLENGKTAYVDILNKDEIAFGSTEFIVLSKKEEVSNSMYIYYLMVSSNIRNQAIKSMVGTSGRQRVQNDMFSKILIVHPPLTEQHSIAKILSDLDSKIELLQKQNKTLEKIGQAIFKQWFVEFEFPNDEGKPYKSSGGKMVESELGEIPEGWSVGNYGDLLEFERGIEPGSKNYLTKKEKDSVLFHRVGDLVSDSTLYVKKNILKNKFCSFEDVLVSFDGTVGRVKFGLKGSYSTGIRKIYSKSNKFSNDFIYFLMKSKFIQDKITEFAKGTTILHAGESIKYFITAIPNDKILELFEKSITSLFKALINNTKEIKNLQKTRDLLLPKLMSGKIRVPLEDSQ